MEFITYARKPFTVQAVQVTEENFEEIAAWLGEVDTDEKTNAKFIRLNPRMVPNLWRIWPGFWVTKTGEGIREGIRCYSDRVFHKQYIENSDTVQKWIDWMNKDEAESTDTPKDDISVGES